MRIIFLGAGAFGLPALEAVAAAGHTVAAVVSPPDRPAGRGNQLTATPVARAAAARGWAILKPEDANAPDVVGRLREIGADCLVVIAFGQKLSDELLGVARFGGINLHSSLLPKYRGAAPINWAVINNDPEAGVSVIEVTHVMDGGAILAQAATPVGRAETAGELHDRLAALGAPLVPQVLEALANGTAVRARQDPALATRAPKLRRDMAWVDWSQPAEVASARVRGLSPWPGVAVELIDATAKVRTQATILKCQARAGGAQEPAQYGAVLADRTVACGTGSVEIITIQPAGKCPMELAAFANGYGFGPGARLRSVVAVPGSRA